ncbi:unnamed protein product [marine sediment metagenome]|uniref:Metallo-beta-lactamase domain-containing protein n=1 Tax=marine sediment metagenome TaxID=412755 RepID=X0V4E4_9ZZZZ
MRIRPILQLADNYAYLVIDEKSGHAGVVDCASASSVLAVIKQEGVHLTTILPTHPHFDHTGGHRELLQQASLEVVGHKGDGDRIPGCTVEVGEGDSIKIGNLIVHILFVPGHTQSDLAYYIADEEVVFTGDTLFAGGCGRLFEGDAEMMLNSLSKLKGLPEETKVYFGHEYTKKNLQFALTLEPKNRALHEKYEWAQQQQREKKPTTPSTIKSEKETNPFFRWASPELRSAIQNKFPNLSLTNVNVFAKTRILKDQF